MKQQIQLPPDVQIQITDEPEAFAQAKASGSCVIATLSCGVEGADYYIEKAEDIETLSEDFFRRVYDRFAKRPHRIRAGGELCLRERTGEDYAFLLWLYAFHAGAYLSADSGNRAQEEHRKRYFEFVSQTPENQAMEKLLFEKQEREKYRFFDFGLWMVEYQGKTVGMAGLEATPMGVTLGYLLAPEYRGRGLAAIACKAVLAYAKEELDIREVYCVIHPENTPSLRLAGQLGFVRVPQTPAHTGSGQSPVILRRVLKEP